MLVGEMDCEKFMTHSHIIESTISFQILSK